MSDLYGDLWRAESRSRVGNRHVCVTYLTRPATTKNAEDRLELGIIQTELDVLPPMLEFEFDPAGKFKLHGVSPSRPPVVAVKLGDLRIEIPADCQLHQICDGEHLALDENLSMELFQQFVDYSNEFPPKLSQLSTFLDDLASRLVAVSANGYDERIYLRADQDSDYGAVMKVMARVNSAGFSNLGLVTDPISQ